MQNETILNLFNDLSIDTEHTSLSLQRMATAESRMLRDLRLNVSAVLKSAHLSRKEALLLALAVAVNEKEAVLIRAFGHLAAAEGAGDAELAEIHACVTVMNANNVFYRFRHYMDGVPYYNDQPAGLRMSVMMNPVLGKEFFELVSLVVSAVNGCQRCVISHEHSVKQHGATEPRIYDAVRLGAVIKSLCSVI